jgi:zinc transport system substrate-binding protein
MLVSAALAGGAVIAAAGGGLAAPAEGATTTMPQQQPPLPPLKVFVTIPPQAWFVERIGGPRVAVHVLVGPGQSPHTFDPTPQQMARLSDARIFFRIGWPFEERMLEKARAVNPGLRVVDTREGIALRWMTPAEIEADERAEAREKPAGAPSVSELPAKGGMPTPPLRGHASGEGETMPSKQRAGHATPSAAAPSGEADPHFWLNPRYARIQAATIAKALAAADPAHADEFRKNLAAVEEDLGQLDARLAEALAPLKGRNLFVYHPAFGYFADAYGLRQVPVEIEGKEPTARQLARLIARAKAEGVRVIFVQPQFSAKSAEAVAAAIGGTVIRLDDLAKDYLANLADMAEKVRRALAGEKDEETLQKTNRKRQ